VVHRPATHPPLLSYSFGSRTNVVLPTHICKDAPCHSAVSLRRGPSRTLWHDLREGQGSSTTISVQRLLGATGADVISRISGLILAALAVETILQGIRASFTSLNRKVILASPARRA
jgi:hypothetical protein